MILQPKLEVDSQCSVIAESEISVPDALLLARVLQDNGYSGHIGIPILHEYYGKGVSAGTPDLLAFFGVYYGKQNRLLSNVCLKWHHCVLRRAMNAGFLDCEAPDPLFRILSQKLGAEIDIDVIGCISATSAGSDLTKASRTPPQDWLLGVCQRGWLMIDIDFFLLFLYESLSDLLQQKSGIEIVSNEN